MLTTRRSPQRGRVGLVAAALLLAVAAPVSLAVPATPAAASEHHPCPLEIDDYGSAVEWGLACVDHLAQHGGADGGDAQVCELDPNPWGIPISCVHHSYGWWSNTIGCWLRAATPQPPPDDPVWAGNDPGDGVVYVLTCPWFQGVDGLPYWEWPLHRFFPADQGMVRDLVERAVGQLVLTGPDIGIAPDPGGIGLVGLPVWMWTAVNERTWAPPPVSLTALGWTVVADAAVERVVWDMGNGDTVVCEQPGTPYQDHFGAEPSPDCGYDGYALPSRSQPGGVYQVTATTHWLVRWRFDGTAVGGTEAVERQSSTAVRIHELQVVTS